MRMKSCLQKAKPPRFPFSFWCQFGIWCSASTCVLRPACCVVLLLRLRLRLRLVPPITTAVARGAVKKKKSDVSKYFFWKLRKEFCDFFYRVFELPLVMKRPKTRYKKKRAKQSREQKTEGKKAAFFCDEPR
jgi:hypothetical protein